MTTAQNRQKKAELTPAVIYPRYSSDKQSEQSIEGQLRDCYAFAEREGYSVVGEYIDRALSAKTDDRPAFQRMIADAEKGQFRVIIVWKLDRFARNRYDSAFYKAKLKKCGVKVVSAMENISDNPEGIILEGMLESLAEYYSANLSQNTRRGLRESLLKGQYTGSRAPIGFKLENKRLVIDENKAHFVQYIFEQYAKGISKKRIIEELVEKGLTNKYGRALSQNCLQTTLRNTKYIGRYKHGPEQIPCTCPALISEELFEKVQDKLDARKRAPAASNATVDYLLTGKAYCGYCGTNLRSDGGHSKSGRVYHYYACGKRKRFNGCNKQSEKKGFLEWYVTEQTIEYVLSPERIDYIAARLVEAYNNEFDDKHIRDMERRILRLDGEIDAAVDTSIAVPPQSRQRYIDKVVNLETQKADIELDLARLKIAAGVKYTAEQITAWLKTFCRGDPLDFDFQRRIIDLIVNSVYVYDDKIVIYYNIKGGKQVSYMEMLDTVSEPPEGLDGENCDSTGVRFSGDEPPPLRIEITLILQALQLAPSRLFLFSRTAWGLLGAYFYVC